MLFIFTEIPLKYDEDLHRQIVRGKSDVLWNYLFIIFKYIKLDNVNRYHEKNIV